MAGGNRPFLEFRRRLLNEGEIPEKAMERRNGDDCQVIAIVEAPGIEAGPRRHFNVKRVQLGDEEGDAEPPFSPHFSDDDADPAARQRLESLSSAAGSLAVLRATEDAFDRLWADDLGITISSRGLA